MMCLLDGILNDVHVGDNVEFMKRMPSDCIDLTITSPPYDDLRKYNGYSFDFESVADELFRITKPGGVLVWVVGDKTEKGSETLTSFKQALHFKEIGFNVHDTMIYAKPDYVPLTHNRYEQQFEYMFILSKGKPKTFNPIKIPCIHAGQNNTTSHRRNSDDLERGSGYGKKINNEKIKPNIWFYNVGKNKSTKDKIAHKHPAIFPEQLAQDHILSWCNIGDIVFDCFAGSGTTLKVAMLNDRNYLGVEISEEYVDISKKRISEAQINR